MPPVRYANRRSNTTCGTPAAGPRSGYTVARALVHAVELQVSTALRPTGYGKFSGQVYSFIPDRRILLVVSTLIFLRQKMGQHVR